MVSGCLLFIGEAYFLFCFHILDANLMSLIINLMILLLTIYLLHQ